MPRLPLVAWLLALALLLAACGPGGDVAATVGGREISATDVERHARLFAFLNSFSGQPCGTRDPRSGESDASACNRVALGHLIQLSLVRPYAAAHGITVDEQRARDAVQSLDDSAGADQVDQALDQFGATRSQLLAFAREFLTIADVSSAVTGERLGEQRLRQEYEDRIAEFTTVTVQHVLVPDEATADDVYRQMTAPGVTQRDIARLARAVSIDDSAQDNGGVIGPAVASTYVPAFADAVVGLDIGEISRPVHTQFGWHVIRLISKTTTSFADAHDQLVQELAGTEFRDWLVERARAVGVVVNPGFGRLDEDTMLVERIASTDPDEPSPTASPTGATPTGPTGTTVP